MATALFLLDTALNALMLALAVRLGGGRIRLTRVLSGALAGAAAAGMARALALDRQETAWLWLPAAMVMMRIARGRDALRGMIKHALLLLCSAGLLGGMVLSFLGTTGSLVGAYALGCMAAVGTGACAVRSRRAVMDVQHVRITCMYRGRNASFDAMVDSGNTLRDYLTHLPVVVIPEERGRKALHLEDVPLRPIFAQTAGGRVRMDVLAPREIRLEMGGKSYRACAVLALSPQLRIDTPALVPASLLGGHTDGI